jgi:hypothetical protein
MTVVTPKRAPRAINEAPRLAAQSRAEKFRLTTRTP